MKVMIRCEEFEGELTSIREDVIDSLEDGWVVKSVGKINVHHQLHLKDDQSYSSSRPLRWTVLFGNISLSPTNNRWLSFSEGGSPSCMMVRFFVIFWLFVTILVATISTTFTGPANEEVLLQWLMQCREPSVQHLTDSTFEHLTQVEKSHTCAFESGWRW